MAYYTRDTLPAEPLLSSRRPTINEFFLSTYTLSIYNGCEFGCPYCDGWAYNPQAFGDVVRVPLDLPQRLAQELASLQPGDLVAITALSDPYQPAERTYRLTRQVLQLFANSGQPCLLLTKSPLVLEDIALLRRINEQSLAVVMTTLLTTDHHMASRLEGKAPLPALRLDMLQTLKREGIPVGVAMVPLVPYVNDTDFTVRRLLRACIEREVDFVVWDYLYMPNRHHRNRIGEMISRVKGHPARYYNDLYGEQQLPKADYRAGRNLDILRICDEVGIPTPAPHRLYAGRIAPLNEAALVFKHAAFRNALQGQHRMADLHRELADLTYSGQATPERLRSSPLWSKVKDILGYGSQAT
jgi:DNA repair photolyase